MKKAVAYLRRSTDRQEQSLQDQEKAIRRYADRHGYEILRVYQDDAVSGTTANGRKAFEEMMADSERPGCAFRYILVYDVSRFSRADNIETGYYLYLLRKRGIEVIYVTENLGTGRRSDGARSLKQTIALEQTVEVSEKTFRGLLTISQQGFWLGGVPPYGYDLECENSEGGCSEQ